MKRIVARYFISLAALSVLLVFESCGNPSPVRQPEEFMISIDSINMPDTLAVGSVLKLQFYGIIGEDQCYRFKRFIVDKNISGYKIKVIGERIFPVDSICSGESTLLDGRHLSLPVTEAGTYGIMIENPGVNKILSRELIVIP